MRRDLRIKLFSPRLPISDRDSWVRPEKRLLHVLGFYLFIACGYLE